MKRIIFAAALLCAAFSAQAQHTLQVDNGPGRVGTFDVSSLTSNRTFTLPNETGTVLINSGSALTINSVNYAWPGANGNGYLYNDGAGNLSWSAAVTSVAGTANRISIGGTAINPIVDISASYVGQNTITTLGTIGTGVWQGTLVAPQYGGTGVNGVAAANGTLLIGNGAGYTLSTLTAGSGATITNGAGTITVSAGASALRSALATYAMKGLTGTASNVLLDLDPSGSITLNEVVIPYSGSVVGISVAANAARTAGTVTFEIYVNNVATGLTVALNGVNTKYNFTTQAAGLDTFNAGDRISIKYTTVGWTPVSVDVVVLPIIEY